MRTRRSVLVGVSSALVVAGCTGSESEPTTEGDDDDSSPTEESFEILNPQLNGQPLDQYDVDFPADVTPEQLADEFQHQLEYQVEGANGPVESTIQVEYTENTIPTEDEDPLNEQIEADVYETGDITQNIQFPDHLVEHLIENPRNIQATLQAEDTETGQKRDREFTLNYADQNVENNFRAAFDPDSSYETNLENAELVKLDVQDELINLEYDSDHEIGSDEFYRESPAGVYSGAIESTRNPYELKLTINDTNGNKYELSMNNDLAKQYLNGEISRGEMRRTIHFDEFRD